MTSPAGRCADHPVHCWSSKVHDVLFVLLTVLVFVILAAIAKGAEKL